MQRLVTKPGIPATGPSTPYDGPEACEAECASVVTKGGLLFGLIELDGTGNILVCCRSLAKAHPSLLCFTNMAGVVGEFSSY